MSKTHNRKVPHDVLSSLQHTTDILALFHKAHTLTPCHISKEVPGKVRDPISNVTRLVRVVALHEAAFKLSTEDTEIFIHQWLKLQGTLEIVQLLDRPETLGMVLIAACAEHILDKVTILKSIVHCDGLVSRYYLCQIAAIPE